MTRGDLAVIVSLFSLFGPVGSLPGLWGEGGRPDVSKEASLQRSPKSRIGRGVALATALGSIVAIGVAVSASATHEVPASAPSIHASLVPAFKQCGTGGNPVNSSHSPPLAVGSCNPPKPSSSQAVVGPLGSGVANIDVIPGDVQLTGTSSDVRTPSGADYDPTPGGTGSDLLSVARIRFTDHYNCSPTPCSGPYTGPGTGTDLDFGPVPINCAANGSPTTPPGSDCNLSTSANTVIAGSVVAGKQAVIQTFRIRINDFTNVLFAQQGIFIP